MPLSASKYIAREDAVTAGRHAGGAYALVILLVFAFMSYNDCLGLSSWQTMFVGAMVIVGCRVGMELWMGHHWDKCDRLRRHKMSQGVPSDVAFDEVRDEN
jgi:hypothetical protein